MVCQKYQRCINYHLGSFWPAYSNVFLLPVLLRIRRFSNSNGRRIGNICFHFIWFLWSFETKFTFCYEEIFWPENCVYGWKQVLNMILADMFQGHPISERKLKELLGHTPSQVFAGALLGILVACFCCQGCIVMG
jgi:hypothetical protein